MSLSHKTVAKYASGTAPMLGIPMEGIGTAVFLRDHLRAALEITPTRIVYNQDTRELTIRSVKSEWKLKNLFGHPNVIATLAQWAGGKRKREATPRLDKQSYYIRRLEEAIAKLEKQRSKIHLYRPENPVNPTLRSDNGYSREQCAKWIAEKPMRKAIAWLAGRKLVHGERTWGEFYKAVREVLGRPVSESQTFARMHGRRAGKNRRYGRWCKSLVEDDRTLYLKSLPEYLGMARHPYTWEPYTPNMEAHADARREYCKQWREVKSLESQIEGHRAEIASALENQNGQS